LVWIWIYAKQLSINTLLKPEALLRSTFYTVDIINQTIAIIIDSIANFRDSFRRNACLN